MLEPVLTCSACFFFFNKISFFTEILFEVKKKSSWRPEAPWAMCGPRHSAYCAYWMIRPWTGQQASDSIQAKENQSQIQGYFRSFQSKDKSMTVNPFYPFHLLVCTNTIAEHLTDIFMLGLCLFG